MEKLKPVETSREEKVYQLNVELKEAKDQLKAATRAHRDEVKRIQAEIDEILAGPEEEEKE